MAGDTLTQVFVIRFRSSWNVGGGVAYTRCLMYSHRKKSNGFRSGERGGHSTQLPYPMTSCWNVFRMYCWTFDIKWRRRVGTKHSRGHSMANPLENRILRLSFSFFFRVM
ncbi:hypothetical protein AVEN_37034-1 [Araneus ventricosus]|uniref:Uncharacterized protein n=1 Tax=Araneus ventricosus TaxID=182803 RepID=A0A4Y2SBH1_ARAVE|nr:hypothetical protein AVEN_37034-1 [Araneus ventricosus]